MSVTPELCGLTRTGIFESGASSAGRSWAKLSSCTTGRSTCRQNVQFQPALASSGVQISVRCPPKKTSPRAPFTIAWYAMKRSCGSDGKRGTMSGVSFDGATPLQAICSVIHTGLPPLASFILPPCRRRR